jgi:hypothetical protein
MRRTIITLVVIVCGLAVGAASAGASGSFSNCTAMHAKYPHGIGRVGAHDKTTGVPVTNRQPSPLLSPKGADPGPQAFSLHNSTFSGTAGGAMIAVVDY